VDTSEQTILNETPSEKRDGDDRSKRSDDRRRDLEAGASVARVARRHAVTPIRFFTGAKSIAKDDWVEPVQQAPACKLCRERYVKRILQGRVRV